MDLDHELLAIERPLWTNDVAIYESSLVEEAMLVFAETGVIRRERALAAIRQENADGRRWADVQFDDVVALRFTPDAALLTYRATARWAHASSPIAVLASSVYVSRGGTWKLAFHQQTPVSHPGHSNRGAM